jgi:hypothetical protein
MPQDGALSLGKYLCPLKDETSIVSDLQEIANSALLPNELGRSRTERKHVTALTFLFNHMLAPVNYNVDDAVFSGEK